MSMDQVRAFLVLLAGVAVISAPGALYLGELYCKQNHLDTPKLDSSALGAAGAIVTILYWAFKRKPSECDEDEPES